VLFRSIAAELIQDGESFIVGSSGPSTLSVPLNSNRAVLEGSIAKATGNGLSDGDCLRAEMDDEMRYRAERAGTAVTGMLNGLPKNTSGRVALLYISDGYARLPAAASVAGLPRIAAQSQVTVFALNPHALRRSPQPAPPGASAVDSCRRDDIMLKSLRAIAEPTGGFAVLEAADFADAFQRIGRALR